MRTRVLMISHAATAGLRKGIFPDDETLDAHGLAQAAVFASSHALPRDALAFSSPAACARETSAALGFDAAVARELAEADHGRWRGRRLMEVANEEPAALAAWTRDPDAAPHGGESFNVVCSRVGRWLDALDYDGSVIALTHAQVIRAALVHVLAAAPESFARIEIAPLSIVELGRSERGWVWRPAQFTG